MSIPLPSPHWQWHFNQNEHSLCLSVGEHGTLKTALNKKVIRELNFCFGGFSVSDTEIFQEFYEKLENSLLFDNLRFAFLVLVNAVATKQFHKEVAAKNWYFEPGAETRDVPLMPLASVKSKLNSGDVLLINAGKNFSTGMLLQDLAINESKTLPCFSLIKVGNERLFNFSGRCLDCPAQHD